MNTKTENMDMLQGSLTDKILKFALPLAATGILQQLFNAADVAVIGQYAGKNAMAAVGSNSPVIGLLVNAFVGIALGANVVISRFTGQKNSDGVRKAVHTSVVFAVLSGIFLTVLGELAAPYLLRLLSVPDDVFPLSLLYLRVYLLGLPVIFLYNFESAIFRSQGDTRTPLICLVISGVINVALNLFFVRVLKMTVDGVATATVVSNLISSAMLFYLLCHRKDHIRLQVGELRIDRQVLAAMVRIGLPAGLQGMVFSISNLCIQSAINRLGSDVMAASSAAFNIEIFAYYVINSFGQACTTFVGQNYGAGNVD
ncbi:MAG: MATE family efflux transporter, partial [Lachnospiraceae bacterium]|nr:MATE family efflux transporter [Lachnospiraceae bacterium]